MTMRSLASKLEIVMSAAETGHGDHAVVVGDRDRVVAVGGVDDDRVHLTVAGAGGGPLQIDADLADVGSGEVVDRDRVGAARCVDVERLRTVHVHRDGADVAGESHPPAVGRDVDFLVDIGAVENERVVTGLALDRVAAVARVPDERVVARAEQGRVVARSRR